jgi:long-chain acyl-CoA synthetase
MQMYKTRKFIDWRHKNKIALIQENGTTITYADLLTRILEFAKTLESRKILFLIGANDAATITAYLSCIEQEVVPLLLDVGISPLSLKKLIDTYKPTYIFLPKNNADIILKYSEKASYEGYILFESKSTKSQRLYSELGILLPTSGSTGSPKLVRLTINNIISNAESIIKYLKIASNDRAITSLPFCYSYGLSVVNSYLAAGASLVLTNRSLIDMKFWSLTKDFKVTSMAGVPFSYKMIIKANINKMDLPSMSVLTQAGGKMPLEDLSIMAKICSEKGIRFYTMYGQTEGSPRIAYLEPEALQDKMGSIGKAIPGGELWLEDERGNRIIEANVVGELVYSGRNVALGYATCEKDLELGDNWKGVLRTGDLAYQDSDGYSYIVGRKSAFIKISGVRVALDEVETWFLERDVVAAALGEDDKLIVAIENGDFIVDGKLKDAFVYSIGIHKTKVEFKLLRNLPRLSNGKIDYDWIRKDGRVC